MNLLLNLHLVIASNLATILACLVAIVALIISARQFTRTQKSTREAQAVDLFAKFNQLNIEQELANNSNLDHWFNNSKFAITEALYEVSGDSVSWQTTVKWMLQQQRGWILEGDFDIESYSKEFREFCKGNELELKP